MGDGYQRAPISREVLDEVSWLEEEPGYADYHASFEVLGWTFYLKNDGGLLVETSRYTPKLDDNGETSAMLALSPALTRALRGVLSAGEEKGEGDGDPFLGRKAHGVGLAGLPGRP